MTLLDDAPVEAVVEATPVEPTLPMVRVAVSAALAAAAAGWVVAGVFDSGAARLMGLLAPLLGAAVAGLAAIRWRTNPLAPYAVLPVALVAGWLAVLPDTGVPRLVLEALRGGGISQPPVAFDPGWRFLLAATCVLVASSGVAVASMTGAARAAPLVGAVVVLFGVLVQPSGNAVVSVAGALVLLAASLAVAVGGEGEGTGSFEVRRLVQGGGALAVLVALVVVLSQFGFLFPDSEGHQVIPPKRPQVPPSVPDRVLFTQRSDRAVPLRLGVLDVYDGKGFLTPPFDSDRFERLGAPPSKAQGVRVSITVADLGGHLLPGVASPKGVTVKGARVEVDPRTDQLRLPKARARKGLRYTVVGAAVPTADELDRAPGPPDRFKEFVDVPAPPPVVADLLAQAPSSSYARLQFLRTALYNRVVAAGAGNPVDVPPRRVAEMLDGKEASPYEITAAEVLLARWAGVPARLGYGYYDPNGNGEIRPRNGATWLEAYFEGFGWVPVIGSPPRAKSSFSRAPKKVDPLVRPTDELALVVYVPVRLSSVQLLYTFVRWWLVRLVPVAVGIGLLWASVPWVLRLLRRLRRRRWAARHGLAGRLLASYAELRDAAIDLNIGSAHLTALEFVGAVAPDDEHAQLAWLVTRGVWGDLRRDLTEDDVRLGDDMAASVLRRLRRAQPAGVRVGAIVSRSSLRAPWSDELPNVSLPRLRPAFALPLVALLVLGTVPRLQAEPTVPRSAVGLPERLAPDRVGDIDLRREPVVEKAYKQAGRTSIVAEGRVLSVRQGDDIEGSLQVGAFKSGISAADAKVRRAVVKSIGRGQFRLTRIGQLRAYVLDLPEQRFLLWFPPDGRSFELLVTRSTFDQADALLTSVVAYQRSGQAGALTGFTGVPVPDPRRGVPG
jgi:transglutaminase-like putative cysteine protease